MSEQGLRYDAGKTRWDLLPFDALHEVAKVSTVGSIKYAPRNWERGMAWSKMVACAMRHLFARMTGERLDPETGLPHTAHFAWNALSLLAYDLRGVGEDDLGDCAKGPTRTVELSPGESKTFTYEGGDLNVVVKPGKVSVAYDLLSPYKPVHQGDQSLTLDDLAEANPEPKPAVPVHDAAYEGVTREEGRLGCSFLRNLVDFGAKK